MLHGDLASLLAGTAIALPVALFHRAEKRWLAYPQPR